MTETVIAGRTPVREALERGDVPLEKVLLQRDVRGGGLEPLRKLATDRGVPVQFVPAGKLNQIAAGATHQGVVALAAAAPYADLDEMLSRIAPTLDEVRARKPLLVALDEITDPHNFGAILRSAVAAGAEGVIVPERNAAPLSATTVKASAGLALRIPVARVGNLATALEQVKERGYWVAGLDMDGDETVWSLDADRALVLVVGSEGRGLRDRVRATCDFVTSIPMRGDAESLNASVATGVALFAFTRDR